jgi:hypothetical protein
MSCRWHHGSIPNLPIDGGHDCTYIRMVIQQKLFKKSQVHCRLSHFISIDTIHNGTIGEKRCVKSQNPVRRSTCLFVCVASVFGASINTAVQKSFLLSYNTASSSFTEGPSMPAISQATSSFSPVQDLSNVSTSILSWHLSVCYRTCNAFWTSITTNFQSS